VHSKLYSDVEGICTGKYGYIVSVISVETIGQNTIQQGTGMAAFNVVYQAIVYRPFVGEVLEGVVAKVIKVSFSLSLLFKDFLSFADLGAVCGQKMGFLAEVGPLQVFVSSHVSAPVRVTVPLSCRSDAKWRLFFTQLIGNDYAFDSDVNSPCWSSDDGVSSIIFPSFSNNDGGKQYVATILSHTATDRKGR
jgi:hypothetical protein